MALMKQCLHCVNASASVQESTVVIVAVIFAG